jgi:hypothetical protein
MKTNNKRVFVKFLLMILSLIILDSCSPKEVLVCGFGGTGDYPFIVNIKEINYLVKQDSITIKGEIIDSLTSEPLIGANIEIQFEDLKELPTTYTDINGNFVLSFIYDPNYLIKFSYVGYRSQSYNLKTFIKQYFDY